jgi:hypothetical protein
MQHHQIEDGPLRKIQKILGTFLRQHGSIIKHMQKKEPPAWIKNLVKKVDNDIGEDKRFIKLLKAAGGSQFRTFTLPAARVGYRKGGTVKRKRSKLRKGGALLFGMKK